MKTKLKRVIPNVPKEEREKLNEGWEQDNSDVVRFRNKLINVFSKFVPRKYLTIK